MIKIEIELKDLDYDSLVEQYLPLMADKLQQTNNPVAMLLSNGMSSSMAKTIIKKLPKKTKDQLAADLVNSYKEKVVKIVEEAADRQNIHVEIGNIQATVIPND